MRRLSTTERDNACIAIYLSLSAGTQLRVALARNTYGIPEHVVLVAR